MAEVWEAGTYTLLDDRFNRINEETGLDEIKFKGEEVKLNTHDANRLGKVGSIAKTDSPLSKKARGEIEEVPFTQEETADELKAKLDVLKARYDELTGGGESVQAESVPEPQEPQGPTNTEEPTKGVTAKGGGRARSTAGGAAKTAQ